MDAARKKAIFRSKLNAQKKEKPINSPLVRYNEFDQPVCRVCDVVLKSDSQWDAHQASRKHHEAIKSIKAGATGNNSRMVSDAAKPEAGRESSRSESGSASQNAELENSAKLGKARPASVLPSHFFDNQEAKRPKTDSVKLVDPDSTKPSGVSAKTQALKSVVLENEMDELPNGNAVHAEKGQPFKEHPEKSKQNAGSEAKQIKGALPEGFFDNKDADLLACGINLVGGARKPFSNKDRMSKGRGKHPHDISRGRGSKHFKDKPTSNYQYRLKQLLLMLFQILLRLKGVNVKQPKCFEAPYSFYRDYDLHSSSTQSDCKNIHPD